MWNVLENSWLLLTLAGVALVAASLIRQEKPEWGYKPLLVPVLLAALAFGLDAAFTTDYEAVSVIVPACKRAAIETDANRIMEFISGDYTDRVHENKAALNRAIESILPRASIEKIRTQSHVISIKDSKAQSELKVVVHLNNDNQYTGAGGLFFVEMAFEYEKIEKQWFIQSMDITSINNQPMNWGDIH
ncbi:MAG: hypothetical protein DRP52_00590 [Planctomycetota bacterium]|nr:MAG: hypothetical protein DRP52_00590 [Planctomycetota bacterium]